MKYSSDFFSENIMNIILIFPKVMAKPQLKILLLFILIDLDIASSEEGKQHA